MQPPKTLNEYYQQKGQSLPSVQERSSLYQTMGLGDASQYSGAYDQNVNFLAKLLNRDGQVTPIATGSGFASSTTKSGQYNADSAKLDGVIGAPTGAPGANNTVTPPAPPQPAPKPPADGFTDKDGNDLDKWANEKIATQKADAQTKIDNYTSLFNTASNALDTQYQSQVQNLTNLYTQRIKEQERINKLKIDRVKSYGLGSGNAQYTPIEFGDSITLREQEGADKITQLESEKNTAIMQAKSARDTGQANLLRQKLEDIDRITKEQHDTLAEITVEAEKKYKLAREIAKNDETEHLDRVKKMVEIAKATYLAEFEKAKTPEERQKLVRKFMEEKNLDPNNGDIFASIISGLGNEVVKKQKDALDIEKDKVSIANTKSEMAKRYADMAKEKGETVKSKKESLDADVGTVILDFKEKMQKNVWKGANPDAYNEYTKQLVEQYGSSALTALNKAMKEAGIIVDKTDYSKVKPKGK